MSDADTSPETPQPGGTPGPNLASEKSTLTVVYILYFAGLLTGGVTALIGLVMAYVKRGDAAGSWIESHYVLLIRTFWICLLYSAVGFVLTFILIGFLIFLLTLIWYIVRLVKGYVSLTKDQPIEDPQTWLV